MIRIYFPNSYCFAAIATIKILKRLSKHKFYFIGSSCESKEMTSGSNLLDLYIEAPIEKDAYHSFLIDTINTNNCDIVFPTHDDDLRCINAIANQIKAKFIIANSETLNLFEDKYLASLAVNSLGIKIPKILLENADSKFIFRLKKSVGSENIKIFNPNQYLPFSAQNSFVQEYMLGDEFTVDVLSDKKGVPHLILPRKRLEIRKGLSFKTELCNNNQLIKATSKICEHFKIAGLFNIQFIIKDAEVYFIELNPRLGGSASSGILASFNYLDEFFNHFLFNKNMIPYEEAQAKIAWGSIITRYYEEYANINT